jgi:hypothetical protein
MGRRTRPGAEPADALGVITVVRSRQTDDTREWLDGVRRFLASLDAASVEKMIP